jgi:hypothetical protein
MRTWTLPLVLLRLEGLALFGAALVVYLRQDYSLLLAALVFLAPDLSFAGYLAGPRIGSYAYNALHTTIGPLVLGTAGVLGDESLAIAVALVWLGHIGFDRTLGFGLKYPSAFADTHLERV